MGELWWADCGERIMVGESWWADYDGRIVMVIVWWTNHEIVMSVKKCYYMWKHKCIWKRKVVTLSRKDLSCFGFHLIFPVWTAVWACLQFPKSRKKVQKSWKYSDSAPFFCQTPKILRIFPLKKVTWKVTKPLGIKKLQEKNSKCHFLNLRETLCEIPCLV